MSGKPKASHSILYRALFQGGEALANFLEVAEGPAGVAVSAQAHRDLPGAVGRGCRVWSGQWSVCELTPTLPKHAPPTLSPVPLSPGKDSGRTSRLSPPPRPP